MPLNKAKATYCLKETVFLIQLLDSSSQQSIEYSLMKETIAAALDSAHSAQHRFKHKVKTCVHQETP